MYKAEITHKKDMVFAAKVGNSEFMIDAQGQGVTPLDALLAGLGSCIGVYIRKYAAGSKLELKEFKINVSAALSTQPPFYFERIEVDIDLLGATLDERRQKALLEFIKHCPAHNTLKGHPEIEFKLQEN